jgi:DNA-binding CsgD family transcriptional regulator
VAQFRNSPAPNEPLSSAVPLSNIAKMEPRFGKMSNFNDPPKQPARMPEVGILLLDESSKVIACDRGASTLLGVMGANDDGNKITVSLPSEIVEALAIHRDTEKTQWKVQFRVGPTEYVCRCYVLQTPNGRLAELSFIALHLERVAGADEAINEAIAIYRLTDREQQTLRGILLGLSTKEVADQMRISPNTVKAFTRLIMIKLGVTTRWGIIAKILGNRELPEEGARSAAGSRAP